ncbi:MAG: MFS transporter [Candidatus Dormibacteraeota bacterium]|nr:MFS transporter [Candidatus Dormibacteraeota bacterium]
MSRTVSSVGDGIALIALILYVKETERSGVAVGALLLAQSLPHLLGPLAGVIVDRVDLKRLMVLCEVAQAGIYAAIAWWQPPFALLLPVIVVTAILDTTFGPAAGSAVPAIVEASDLRQANAWMGTSLNLQVAVGPVLSGLLVLALGVRGALGANALSFALSAVLLATLPRRLGSRAGAVARGIVAAGSAGLRFAWQQPALRGLLGGTFLIVAFLAVDNVALVFLIRDTLRGNALAYGAVAGAFGVGMLLSSVALSWIRSAPRSTSLLIGGWLLSAITTIATGAAPNVGVAAAAQAAGGVANGIENVASSTLIQEVVPAAMLGRVFGLFGTAASGGSALAYALAGFLIDATSPRLTFIIAGIGALAVALVAGPLLGRSPVTAV